MALVVSLVMAKVFSCSVTLASLGVDEKTSAPHRCLVCQKLRKCGANMEQDKGYPNFFSTNITCLVPPTEYSENLRDV